MEWGGATAPAGLTNLVSIAAGGDYSQSIQHSLAMDSSGTLTNWGYTGNGLTNIPAGATNVMTIACGAYHNLAFRNDGTVLAWGAGTNIGSSPNLGQSLVPGAASNALAISGGGFHSLAIVDAGAPIFLTQPAGATLPAGYGIVLSPGAVGPGPLRYQWRLNGTDLQGVTNSSLTLTNLQAGDGGTYTVTAANDFGTNTSNPALLVVLTNPPSLTPQSLTQTVLSSNNVPLNVTATGAIPITFQWQFNGEPISGATNAALNLNNVQLTNAGTYRLLAENAFGSTNSPDIVLTVLDSGLGFALNATNLVWTTGGNVPWIAETTTTIDGVEAARSGHFTANGQSSILQTSVTGPGTLTFWAQSVGTYLLFEFQYGMSTSFIDGAWKQETFYMGNGSQFLQWIAAPPYGLTDSTAAYLDQVTFVPGGTPPVVITAPTSNQIASAGATVNLRAAPGGTPPLVFQWQWNAQNLTNGTNATLILSDVQAASAGTYNLIISNDYGVTNTTVILTVNPAGPTIAYQSTNQSAVSGTAAALSASTAGTEPFSYQWLFNGNPLMGATNATVLASNAGSYLLLVTNAVGNTNSATMLLTVGPSVVVAWGDNTYGQTNVPPGITNAVAIGAGSGTAYAIQGDGHVIAWGINTSGETNVPTSVSNSVTATGGQGYSLALGSNGIITSWGSSASPYTQGQGSFVAVSAGRFHSLALESNGAVVGAGMNTYGESTAPTGLSNVVAVAAGYEFSLALRSDGTVVAWGDSYLNVTNVPAGLSNVVAIAASDFYTALALKSDGIVVAWGDITNVPAGLSNVVAISAAGGSSLLALRADGSVVEWGFDGVPTYPLGLSNAVAIAGNDYGGGASSAFAAIINNGAPVIARQPFDQIVQAGMNPVITAGVVGAQPLNYQWQFNGAAIPGATNPSSILTNIAFTNQGAYRLTVSNAIGSVTSTPALITVLRATPQFSATGGGFRFSTNGFSMNLSGLSADGPVVIFRSTDLTNWLAIYTNPPVTGSLQFLDATNSPAMFYKAVEQ